jgi:hypothetical protein
MDLNSLVLLELNIVSVFGPGRALSRRVNTCCVLPNPDGYAKRNTRGFILIRAKKALRPAEKASVVFSCTEVPV